MVTFNFIYLLNQELINIIKNPSFPAQIWKTIVSQYLNKTLKKIISRLNEKITPLFLLIKIKYFWVKKKSCPHKLDQPLIVSLTSYPPRFKYLSLTLKCLISQSIQPTKIILWIAFQDKNLIPKDVIKLEKYGLDIKYCEDIKSYKKIIPSLKEHPASFIVTADDDIFYWHTWLEELVNEYNGNNLVSISHRAHKITLKSENTPCPYKSWLWDNPSVKTNTSALNFPTGCGGILYPPNIFYQDVLDKEKFMNICPSGDDIWLYWMVRLNGGKTRKIYSSHKIHYIPKSQKNSLCTENVDNELNDQQISNLLNHYKISFI